MNTTYSTKKKLLAASLGVAATAVVAPALLFAGAGTAQATCGSILSTPYEEGQDDWISGECESYYDDQSLFDRRDYEQGRSDGPF